MISQRGSPPSKQGGCRKETQFWGHPSDRTASRESCAAQFPASAGSSSGTYPDQKARLVRCLRAQCPKRFTSSMGQPKWSKLVVCCQVPKEEWKRFNLWDTCQSRQQVITQLVANQWMWNLPKSPLKKKESSNTFVSSSM